MIDIIVRLIPRCVFISLVSMALLTSGKCGRKSSSDDDPAQQTTQSNPQTGNNNTTTTTNNSSNTGGGNPTNKTTTTYFLTNCFKDLANTNEPELYLSKNTGTFEQLVPDNSQHTENVEISTNGEYVAYTKGGESTQSEVYVMKLSDKSETRITNNTLQDTNPNFLNDANGNPTWIVWFRVKSDGISNLFLRKVDLSSSEVNISSSQSANYWDPECSPDGKMIAYVYDSTGASACSTVIAIADINSDKTLLINHRVVSETTPRARTDPSWNSSSTMICYDIWDYDLVQYPSACWSEEGLQDGYQQYWKIVMVNKDGSNRQVIFSGINDDPFPVIPIWKKDNGDEILVIGVYSKASNQAEGKYFQPYLLKKGGNSQYTAEVYRNDTLNCVWFDYIEVTK
ncbi:MAG: hypothetical protein HY606_11500 [Planctomycetes bacterium]|nr:hypothetical protein [Planctomycetota bacterium]